MLKTIMRRVARVGVVGAAVTAIGLTAVPAASAITWYSNVPSNASNVTTMTSSSLPSGGTLQIRRGKYNGSTYYWGRVASPANRYDSGYHLYFYFSGLGCSNGGSTGKDIYNTTYTSAGRKNTTCLLVAQVVYRSNGTVVRSISYDLR